jgi:hypothetical protein
MVHSCNPNSQEADAGGLTVLHRTGLHRDTMSQKKKKYTEEIIIRKRKEKVKMMSKIILKLY